MSAVPADAGRVLLPVAASAIARAVGLRTVAEPTDLPAWTEAAGAAFVTLTRDGELRGCIGSLLAHRPLADDVRANAVAAATRDPRFSPVRASEARALGLEVSVLSAPEPFPVVSRADAEARLRPGVDGVILQALGRAGTFLPQVWEDIPEPSDFLDHLLLKAGLPPSYWGPDVTLRRYTVTAWSAPFSEAAS